MYCGVVLPDHQKFSELEKEEALALRRKAELDDVKAKLFEHRRSSGSSDSGLDLSIALGSISSGES